MKFIRYISIQIFAYGIDMGVFYAFFYLGVLGAISANVLGKIAAGFFAFLVHRSFTFRLSRKDHNQKQVVRYFLLLGLNIPMSSSILSLLLLITDLTVAAKFISDVICVLFSFWLSKNWVFVPKHKQVV